MNKAVVTLVAVATFFNGLAQTTPKKITVVAKPPLAKTVAPKPVFKNLLDSFSYAVGFAIANNMKQQNVKRINTEMVQKAMADVYNNKPLALDQAKINDCLQRQSQIFAEEKKKDDVVKEAELKVKAQPEIAKGQAFLAANKLRTSVTTLPDGLQYEVLKKSDSATLVKPTANDVVKVNYIGTLIDGKEFDNSYKRGEPATFQVGGVIKGWTEILQLMSVGDKWKVFIPTELAYNLNPRDPNTIPPGAVLIFEISLEGITSPKQ